MRKFIIAAATVATLAAPTAALAAAPGYVFKASGTNGNPNLVATDSSQLTHNGSPSDTFPWPSVSQQAQSGDRAANVQGLLGH